jgi:hypothetical protein
MASYLQAWPKPASHICDVPSLLAPFGRSLLRTDTLIGVPLTENYRLLV